MQEFRAGIVGCGRIACEFDDDPKRKEVATHAGAYTKVEGVDLVAACDVDKNKLEKCGNRWQIPHLYQDLGEMLRNEALDILSVCTWNLTHLDIIREAVNHGVKAIFCEKPIADSLASANEIIELCQKENVILQVDHQRRFDKFHQDVRAFLHDGRLGRIQQVGAYYTAGIANTCSHMFDLLRFFVGDVEWVRAVYSENKCPNENDPNIDGLMKFRNGALCSIQACDVSEFMVFEMDCIGTKGRLSITHSGFDAEFQEVRASEVYSSYKEIYRSEFPFGKDAPREYMLGAVNHLVECLEKGQKPICSGEDGKAALELICAFHESARNDGRKIPLPLVDSEVRIASR